MICEIPNTTREYNPNDIYMAISVDFSVSFGLELCTVGVTKNFTFCFVS